MLPASAARPQTLRIPGGNGGSRREAYTKLTPVVRLSTAAFPSSLGRFCHSAKWLPLGDRDRRDSQEHLSPRDRHLIAVNHKRPGRRQFESKSPSASEWVRNNYPSDKEYDRKNDRGKKIDGGQNADPKYNINYPDGTCKGAQNGSRRFKFLSGSDPERNE
jgi:hypothetical protein